jgi:hypothetical protein
MPAVPYDALSGFAFSQAISSFKSRADVSFFAVTNRSGRFWIKAALPHLFGARFILASVKLLSCALTDLNFDPSTATLFALRRLSRGYDLSYQLFCRPRAVEAHHGAAHRR